MYHFPWILGLAAVICAVVLSPTKWLFTDDAGELSTEVVVGILSSRSNFRNRQAIRQTWLNTTRKKSSTLIKGWFIIGRKACLIPPDDRVDINSCTLWDPKDADGMDTQIFSPRATKERSTWHQPINEGFAFKVLHPVIVNKLGYMENVVQPEMQTFTVSLKNAFSQDTIVKIEVSPEKIGVLIDGIRYLPVTPYVLPKGFEASVVIEMPHEEEQEAYEDGQKVPIHSSFKQQWQDAGGLISFTQVFRNIRKNLVFKHKKSDVSATSVGFSIYGKDQLKEHIAQKVPREKEWLTHIHKEDEELRKEVGQYNDIVLVDLIDVYQNLPLKLLGFIEWATRNYKFKNLLKTDDDCVLDIDKILDELKNKKVLSEDHTWWSKFRFNWIADRVSKWAELDYSAPVYPPFGCGLGNLLSADLVHWLASNANKLHSYQGEDVSLGIWLAAILPKYMDDPRWQCDAGCVHDSFNVGQLKPEEIITAWESLQLCNSLCGC